jgi:hypothetical protein
VADAIGAQNLADGLHTDLFDDPMVYQIIAHPLQRPLGKRKPHLAGVTIGQRNDLIPLLVGKDRRTTRRFAAAQAISSFGIEPMDPLAYIDGVHLNFPAYILAVLFKDDALTKNEHYVESHLKHKCSLFAENLTADIAMPYLSLVAKRTLKSIQGA